MENNSTEYQGEWRDEMLDDLLQLVGWYKLGLPTRENFKNLMDNHRASNK